jgi:hypothetical protein
VLRSESGQRAEVGRGGSCFVSAADGVVSCKGRAHLFLATSGPNPQTPPPDPAEPADPYHRL